MSVRQRDIFPIPTFDNISYDRHAVSHCTRKRLSRKNKVLAWANEGITVLNRVGSDLPLSASNKPSGASILAAQNILNAYKSMPPPPADFCSEGALTELLNTSGFYTSCRTDIQSYAKDLVSWPSAGAKAVELQHHLDGANRELLLDWRTAMLRTPQDFTQYIANSTPLKPYIDPELAGSPLSYSGFLERLHEAGMLRFRLAQEKSGALGLFFIKKKDGTLRLIFDTRKLNRRFKEPPHTDLPTASAMSHLECVPDNPVFLGSGDIKNAFYSLKVPTSLSDMFTLPLIRNRYLPAALQVDSAGPDTWIAPCLQVLPMGWNWALHLCQAFMSHIVSCACPSSKFFTDHTGTRHLTHKHETLTTCYVDNFCVIGHDPKEVDSQLRKIHSRFTELGCVVHEQCSASTTGEFVGLSFANGVFSIKTSRIWRLRLALTRLLRLTRVSGHLLEIITGHITWAMLMRREALAFLNHTYQFIHQYRESSHTIPPEVKQELQDISSLLPLLRSDSQREWSDRIHASDASPTGLGVCSRRLPIPNISSIGRVTEKWRYRVADAISARRSALGCPLPQRAERREIVPLSPEPSALHDCQLLDLDKELYQSVCEFEEVPPHLLTPHDWNVVCKKPV